MRDNDSAFLVLGEATFVFGFFLNKLAASNSLARCVNYGRHDFNFIQLLFLAVFVLVAVLLLEHV